MKHNMKINYISIYAIHSAYKSGELVLYNTAQN